MPIYAELKMIPPQLRHAGSIPHKHLKVNISNIMENIAAQELNELINKYGLVEVVQKIKQAA